MFVVSKGYHCILICNSYKLAKKIIRLVFRSFDQQVTSRYPEDIYEGHLNGFLSRFHNLTSSLLDI